MTRFTLTIFFALTLNLFLSAQVVIWTDIPDPKKETQQIYPESYRTMSVDFETLKSLLLAAPAGGIDLRSSNYTFQLPTPDGKQAIFKIVEESVMAPELQVRYPEIRTYVGLGTGDYASAIISLDFTLKGFHAQILIEGKSYYIDPLSSDDLNTYMIYTRESFFISNSKEMGLCEPEDIGFPQPGDDSPGQKPADPVDLISPLISNGTQLRTYQLALACTGEYAQFQGGTKPLVLSAMATTMNRVNSIYRRDLCLRMLLIANNDDLIFLNALFDGYSNNDGAAMLTQNQTKTDLVIGSSNYDIGHVFSTGGGGFASIGVVCNNSLKAHGVTGISSPVGDPFDIDYVAHEMGHQWSAKHTQNNLCNRISTSAYEPGSGSTIMGNAGNCAPNLQSNNDAYFHNQSYNQIVNYSVTGAGNSCATITPSFNTPPNVSVLAGGFFIPKSTPFELPAIAVDQNGDVLTYCWEQYNLGPATVAGDDDLAYPSGNAPTFRSWSPTSTKNRFFPRISDLVNNTSIIGERLPTYARNLTFRCTVRDNYINGAVDDDQLSFDVVDNAGPFLVTSPNTSVTWGIGTNKTITWDVANTTASPVSCSTVNIFLSTDGGYTFPTLLLGNAPNDGSATITLPNIPTTQARIKVNASLNLFFDISDQDFTISALPPENDAICDAISISCGADVLGTTVNATSSSLGIPSCSPVGSQQDVFYKFSAIAGKTYTISVSGTNYNGVLGLYKGICSGLMTEIACSEEVAYGTETIDFTPDSDMLVYIRTFDPDLNGEFTISLDCILTNDDPCNALLLSCGSSVSGSTVGATTSTIGSASCALGSSKDVFYKINAIAGVDYSVSVTGVNYNGVTAAYTGLCNGIVTELDCVYNLLGTDHTVDFSVTTDQTVLIQTYQVFTPIGGNFQIEVSCSNLPNDDPCDAIELYCGESYSGSSSGASYSSLGYTSCATGSATDLFFKFTALANIDYSVTLDGSTYDGVIAAYTGLCSGSLTEIACANNGGSTGIAETIDILVSTEQEILIQIYDYNAPGLSNYSITLNCPIPINDDCADAISLTVNEAGMCPANQVEGTTYGATGSNPDACNPDSPDIYYIFNSGDSEEVIIHFDYITAGDLELSLFEENCSAEAILCSYALSNLVSVTPNTNYYLRLHSYLGSATGTFNICIEKVTSEIATINGSISGWNSNCTTRNVKVNLLNKTTLSTTVVNTTLSASGAFTVDSADIYAGSYQILVKVQGALAVLSMNVVLNGGPNSLITGPVMLGDLNNNNVINILDLSIFSASFGTTVGSSGYNFLADLNCDGVINIFDVSILSAGFNHTGDTFAIL